MRHYFFSKLHTLPLFRQKFIEQLNSFLFQRRGLTLLHRSPFWTRCCRSSRRATYRQQTLTGYQRVGLWTSLCFSVLNHMMCHISMLPSLEPWLYHRYVEIDAYFTLIIWCLPVCLIAGRHSFLPLEEGYCHHDGVVVGVIGVVGVPQSFQAPGSPALLHSYFLGLASSPYVTSTVSQSDIMI